MKRKPPPPPLYENDIFAVERDVLLAKRFDWHVCPDEIAQLEPGTRVSARALEVARFQWADPVAVERAFKAAILHWRVRGDIDWVETRARVARLRRAATVLARAWRAAWAEAIAMDDRNTGTPLNAVTDDDMDFG